jgi:hypothetical protein
MTMIWTYEKVKELSLVELKNLQENATRKGNQEVVSLCEAELISRKPKPNAAFALPEGFVKVTRTAVSKMLEKDVCELLEDFANELSTKYDFGAEKARSLSIDTKRFAPHELLAAKGKAKTGGFQKSGRVVFDRYISYRLKNDVYALVCLLIDGEDESGVRYLVLGSPNVLPNFRPLQELRPELLDGEKIGLSAGGEGFDNFKEASARFAWMIDQVAPKL